MEEIIEEIKEEPVKVYIEINENNEIIKVFSSEFEEPKESSILIDSGFGDKYMHAQNNYLDKPLLNDEAEYNYKYIDNKIVEV